MSKLRVVHVISSLRTGGAEMMMYKLIKSLNPDEYENYVISLSGGGVVGDMIADLGVPVIALDLKGRNGLVKGLIEFRKSVRRIGPSIIQGWMYHGNVIASLGKILAGGSCSLIWNVRHTFYKLSDEKKVIAWLIRLGAKLSFHPDSIVFNSRESSLRHQDIGYRENKTIIIPNGFDVNLFASDPQAKIDMRKALNVNPECLLVGIVARFHPMKGLNVLLDAISILKENDKPLHFILVGLNIDTNNRLLVKKINELGLDHTVHLLGSRKDIPKIMASLDVFVLSSLWGEAFPNVVGEAMASAVPCVATDLGDTAELVGETGVIVAPNDASALAQGMGTILDFSVVERQRWGSLARRRILDNYTLLSIVGEYDTLYKSNA